MEKDVKKAKPSVLSEWVSDGVSESVSDIYILEKLSYYK